MDVPPAVTLKLLPAIGMFPVSVCLTLHPGTSYSASMRVTALLATVKEKVLP